MSRRVLLLLAILILLLIALGLRFWSSSRTRGEGLAGLFNLVPSEDRLVLGPASFADLPGWREDAVEEAVPALLRSCERIATLADGTPVAAGAPFAGTAGDWREICTTASQLPSGDRAAARSFFEARFRPYTARNHHNPFGLFTGYFEPLLHGSRRRKGKYTVPIYTRPPELVMVDLGRFREELKGRRIAGQVVNGDLVPYPDRRQIEAGALAGRKLEAVWVDDPIDAFFLHVEGSGRVRLAEGGEMRLGYAAQNGHPYTAIGRELIDRGVLRSGEVSMQSIRAWLAAHPKEAREVTERDASFVFFQEIKGEGPLGADGVPLTPRRSLAVDLRYLPLGVPVWLVCGAPAPREGEPTRRLQRLMIAQDTGGAIQGPRARRRLLGIRRRGRSRRRPHEAPRPDVAAAAEGPQRGLNRGFLSRFSPSSPGEGGREGTGEEGWGGEGFQFTHGPLRTLRSRSRSPGMTRRPRLRRARSSFC